MTLPIVNSADNMEAARMLAARLSAVTLADVLDRVEVSQVVEMQGRAAVRSYTIRFFFIEPKEYKEVYNESFSHTPQQPACRHNFF